MSVVHAPAPGAVAVGASAVSWPAILGGAVAAAVITVVMLLIGSGLGFAAMSPWPNAGASATTFTVVGGLWLIVMQWVSSGVGGYVTGRLRTRWVGPHVHEVFFRDTANGFLAWAVATLIGVALVASSVGTLASGSARAVTSIASGAAQGASQGVAVNSSALVPSLDYGVDRLFRTSSPAASDANASSAATSANAQAARTEAVRIAANAARAGEMPAADRTYLAQLIAARTGIQQSEAEKRVDDMIADAKATAAKAREAADAARKAASAAAIFIALSMLIGAFIACVAAAYGGSSRDENYI